MARDLTTAYLDKCSISTVGVVVAVVKFLVPLSLFTLHILVASGANSISICDRRLLVLVERCGEGIPELILMTRGHIVLSIKAGLDGIGP